MARSRKKAAAKEFGAAVEQLDSLVEAIPENDVFDQAIADRAAEQAEQPVEHFEKVSSALVPTTHTEITEATPSTEPHHQQHDEPHPEQQHGEPEKRKGPRYTYSERAGNNLVIMVDEGNFRGLGIRLDFADRDEKPSPDVLKVIREEKDGQRGMGWVPSLGQSRKGVGRTPEEAIKSRLDVERRTFEAAEQMRKEQAERDGQER